MRWRNCSEVVVKYSQVPGKFPLRQTGIKSNEKKHNPCVITISLESGFQDLEIKVTVGSPAGSRSLLVAATGPPTLSLLLLKCTDGARRQTRGKHTPKGSTRRKGGGSGGWLNDRRGFKQTLIPVQVRGIKAAARDHLIKTLWKGREEALFGWIHFVSQIGFVTVSYLSNSYQIF